MTKTYCLSRNSLPTFTSSFGAGQNVTSISCGRFTTRMNAARTALMTIKREENDG